MNEFSPDWLAMREPFDASTSSAALVKTFAAALPGSPCLVDLGCGTGANIRYLAPLVEGDHSWLAVDGSADLLDRFTPAMEAGPNAMRWRSAKTITIWFSAAAQPLAGLAPIARSGQRAR